MEGKRKKSKHGHRKVSKEKFSAFLHKDKINLVAERASMNAEEKLQLQHGDRFWGVDIERQRAAERLLHDERKQQEIVEQVLHNKRAQMQRAWEAEAVEEERSREIERERKERDAMDEYMHAFWSSSSSDDIIKHHWKTRPSVHVPRHNHHDSSIATKNGFPSVNTTRIETFHRFDPITSAGRRGGYNMEMAPDGHGTVPIDPTPHRHKANLQLEEPIDSSNKLPIFGSSSVPPLGPSFLSPFRTSQSLLDEDPLQSGGSNQEAMDIGVLVVPIPLLREIRFVSARGYLYKEEEKVEGRKWVRVYCALWRTSILYMFRSEEDCFGFFSGIHGANRCVGYIDCEIVVSVKESRRSDLLNRGIDLMSCRSTVTLCTDSDVHFTPWLNTFSKGVSSRNILLYNALMALYSEGGTPLVENGDVELLLGADEVDIGSFNAYTLKYLSLIEQSKSPGSPSNLTDDEKAVLEVLRLHSVIVGCADFNIVGENKSEDESLKLCQLNIIAKSPSNHQRKSSPVKHSSHMKLYSGKLHPRRKI